MNLKSEFGQSIGPVEGPMALSIVVTEFCKLTDMEIDEVCFDEC